MFFSPTTENKLKALSSFYEHTRKLDQYGPRQRQRIRKDLIERIENLSLFGYLEGSQECLELANDLATAVHGKSLSELSTKPFFKCLECFDPYWLLSAYEYSRKIKKADFKETAAKVLKDEEYMPLNKLRDRIQYILNMYLYEKKCSEVSIHDYRVVQVCHVIMMEKCREKGLTLENVRKKITDKFLARPENPKIRHAGPLCLLKPHGASVKGEDLQRLLRSVSRRDALFMALSYREEFVGGGRYRKELEESYDKGDISSFTERLNCFYECCRGEKTIQSLMLQEVLQVVFGLCLHEMTSSGKTIESIIEERVSKRDARDDEAALNLKTLCSKFPRQKSFCHISSALKVSDYSIDQWMMDTVRKTSVDLSSEIFEPKQIDAALELQKSSGFKLDLSILPKSQQSTLRSLRNPSRSSKVLSSARMQTRVLYDKNLKAFASGLRHHYEALRRKIVQKRKKGDLYQICAAGRVYRLSFVKKGKTAQLSDGTKISIPSKWAPEKKLEEIQKLIPEDASAKFTFDKEAFKPLIHFHEQLVTYLTQGILFASNEQLRRRFIQNSWKLAKILLRDQNYDLLNAWFLTFTGIQVSRLDQVSDFVDAKSDHKIFQLFNDYHYAPYREAMSKAGSYAIPLVIAFFSDMTKSQEVRNADNDNILLALKCDESYFKFTARGSKKRRSKIDAVKEVLSIQSTIADHSTLKLLDEASYLIQPLKRTPGKISDRLQHCHSERLIEEIAHDLNRRSAFIYASLFQPGKDMVPRQGESLLTMFHTLSDDFRYATKFYDHLLEQSREDETDFIVTKNLIDLCLSLLRCGNHFALLALWKVLRKQIKTVADDRTYRRRFKSLEKSIGTNGESLSEKKRHLPYPFFLKPFPLKKKTRVSAVENCPRSFWIEVIRYLSSLESCEINPSSLKTTIIREFLEYQKADKKKNRHMNRARMLASAGEVSKKNDLVKGFVENQLSSGKIFTLSYLMSRNTSS